MSSTRWRLALVALLWTAACGGGAPAGSTGGTGGDEPAAGTGGSGTGGKPAAGTGGTTQSSPDAAASGGSIGGSPDAAPTGTGGSDAAVAPADASSGSGVTEGMTSLFDGTTLTGWEQSTPALFTVKDGALDGNGKTGGVLLITSADYGDFRLIVSSRMVANMGGGHLGICFWGGHAPAGKYNACKLLIPPGGGSWDYGGSGGLPGLTKTPGAMGGFNSMDWHQTEIVCHIATGTCRMATDGVDQLTYKEPNPARLKKGPIGLQIHAGTSEVQYKDVWIDAAPADSNLRTAKK